MFFLGEDAAVGFLIGDVGAVFTKACNVFGSKASNCTVGFRVDCGVAWVACGAGRGAESPELPSDVRKDNEDMHDDDMDDDDTEGGTAMEGDATCQPTRGSLIPWCVCDSDGECWHADAKI